MRGRSGVVGLGCRVRVRAAKMRSNSASSSSPMMRGGASRMRCSFAALMMSPRARASLDDAVGDRLGEADADQEAAALDVGDHRRGEVREPLAQLVAAQPGVLDQPGALDLAEHGVRRRGRERVAAEGRAVVSGGEQVARGAEGDERADRESAADALGDRDRVGQRARLERIGVLEREPLPRAAGAGLDLVEDEQRAVLGGEAPGRGEVAVGQVDDAGLALDRLDERAPRRRRPPGPPRAPRSCRRSARRRAAAGRNGACSASLPVRRERAHGAAVEGALERQDAGRGPVQAGELDRRLDRLGPGVREEHPVAAGQPGEALGELDLRLGREVVGDVGERRRLARDRIHEHRVGVTERVDGDAGEEVEVLACRRRPRRGRPRRGRARHRRRGRTSS